MCRSGTQSESSRRQLGLRVRGVESFSWPLGPRWPLIRLCYWSEELGDTVTTTHPRQQPHRRSGTLEGRERERVQDVECRCMVLNESVRNSCASDLANQQSAEAWRSAVKTDTAAGCSAKGRVCPLLVEPKLIQGHVLQKKAWKLEFERLWFCQAN